MLGLFLAVILVHECVKHGIPAATAAVLFLLIPWLPWWPVRLAWIPLAMVVFYVFGTFFWPPFFAAGLGWLTGIAAYRVVRNTRS
ncbi:hypothetical protein B0I29_121143 [Actinoplanes lutulentus]|uniref:Uncharacterized protein n=1 Tax=Actinoplanes lutulentus TaxID=1287878 RepID=A0A327Z9K7_9ACTN|nr:hypothetical protein B0I29_121143 [Actinoplanes lutulentus]